MKGLDHSTSILLLVLLVVTTDSGLIEHHHHDRNSHHFTDTARVYKEPDGGERFFATFVAHNESEASRKLYDLLKKHANFGNNHGRVFAEVLETHNFRDARKAFARMEKEFAEMRSHFFGEDDGFFGPFSERIISPMHMLSDAITERLFHNPFRVHRFDFPTFPFWEEKRNRTARRHLRARHSVAFEKTG